jgi:hypothetical protein
MLKPWRLTILGMALAALSVPSRSAVIAEGYWEDSAQQVCISTNFCSFDFAKVPSGKTLIITHVSCQFSLAYSNGTGFGPVDLIRRDTAGAVLAIPKAHLLAVKTGDVPNALQYWTVSDEVSHVVRQLQSVRIEATAAGTVFYGGQYQACTVSGVLKQ